MDTSSGASFSELLRDCRMAAGLTQEALAERAGISARNIRALEHGSSKPQRETARRLAEALGLTAADLVHFLAAAMPGPRRHPASPARPPDPHRLPTPLTRLIGRGQEVEAACLRLRSPDVRLLTLTGPGGTGKTRLALQVAAELLDEFADGVWFVNLAPLSDPTLVLPTIASTLGVKETGAQPLHETLQTYLRPKQLVLVLDNFEQLLPAAPDVADLLAAAPDLKVLVTSRAPLRLRGEREVAVPPLGLPDLTHLPPLERLTQYDAVRLFIERAQEVKADFQVTNATAPAVAEICHRLDGLPLAIELAAARCKLLPPQALLERLDRRLKVLIGGARDLPARQQTIRATIDWSYHLLPAAEQTLFHRLGVFVGGSTLEAAEAICTGTEDLTLDVLDGIHVLVDNSLLRQEDGPDGEPRFLMLETVHEYARERLAASGEEGAIQRQHAAFFLTLAEQAAPDLGGAAQGSWLHRLEREHANFRAALTWALGSGGDSLLALRLAAALAGFWHVRAYVREGQRWLQRALLQRSDVGPAASAMEQVDAAQQTFWRAKVLRHSGIFAEVQGDYALARALIEESLPLFRAAGQMQAYARALTSLGNVVLDQEDLPAARAIYEESVAVARTLRDTPGLAAALNSLGLVTYYQGDYAAARTQYAESLALAREAQNAEGIGYGLLSLGDVLRDEGDSVAAQACYAESLSVLQATGSKVGMAYGLAGVASLAVVRSEAARAVRLFAAADGLRADLHMALAPQEQRRAEGDIAAARAHLDEKTFDAAWAEGRAMSLEQATAYAINETGPE